MSSASSDEPVHSPCIKVCVLDGQGMCVGCGRRIEEIAGWTQLPAQQQRRIRELAERRLQEAGHDPTPAYGKR